MNNNTENFSDFLSFSPNSSFESSSFDFNKLIDDTDGIPFQLTFSNHFDNNKTKNHKNEENSIFFSFEKELCQIKNNFEQPNFMRISSSKEKEEKVSLEDIDLDIIQSSNTSNQNELNQKLPPETPQFSFDVFENNISHQMQPQTLSSPKNQVKRTHNRKRKVLFLPIDSIENMSSHISELCEQIMKLSMNQNFLKNLTLKIEELSDNDQINVRNRIREDLRCLEFICSDQRRTESNGNPSIQIQIERKSRVQSKESFKPLSVDGGHQCTECNEFFSHNLYQDSRDSCKKHIYSQHLPSLCLLCCVPAHIVESHFNQKITTTSTTTVNNNQGENQIKQIEEINSQKRIEVIGSEGTILKVWLGPDKIKSKSKSEKTCWFSCTNSLLDHIGNIHFHCEIFSKKQPIQKVTKTKKKTTHNKF